MLCSYSIFLNSCCCLFHCLSCRWDYIVVLMRSWPLLLSGPAWSTLMPGSWAESHHSLDGQSTWRACNYMRLKPWRWLWTAINMNRSQNFNWPDFQLKLVHSYRRFIITLSGEDEDGFPFHSDTSSSYRLRYIFVLIQIKIYWKKRVMLSDAAQDRYLFCYLLKMSWDQAGNWAWIQIMLHKLMPPARK